MEDFGKYWFYYLAIALSWFNLHDLAESAADRGWLGLFWFVTLFVVGIAFINKKQKLSW